jgi:hypothetical protein
MASNRKAPEQSDIDAAGYDWTDPKTPEDVWQNTLAVLKRAWAVKVEKPDLSHMTEMPAFVFTHLRSYFGPDEEFRLYEAPDGTKYLHLLGAWYLFPVGRSKTKQ